MCRLSVVTFALLASIGMSVSFHAIGATPPASTVLPADATQRAADPGKHATSVLKPGDRNCLRDTGSLIPPRKGECLSVPGRSYSGDELRRTGTNDNARALQMLDPSISAGGH